MILSKDFDAAMERLLRIGPFQAMCEDELAAGYVPTFPGVASWLPTADWPDDIVVSTNGEEVRIVAIKAKSPGTGAFSRLVTAIARAGLTPVVVEPMFDMPGILTRWGWVCHTHGSGFDTHECWRPSAEWLSDRRQ